MYNLYAKKREKPTYEYITTFYREEEKYSKVGELDESIYQEAIVVSSEGCELYIEFQKPKVRKKVM